MAPGKGQKLEGFYGASTHEWAERRLCTANTSNHTLHVVQHCQLRRKHLNTPCVVNWIIARRDCVGYVYVAVMPIASSGAAHPMVYKMLPSIVGPPRDLDETAVP